MRMPPPRSWEPAGNLFEVVVAVVFVVVATTETWKRKLDWKKGIIRRKRLRWFDRLEDQQDSRLEIERKSR